MFSLQAMQVVLLAVGVGAVEAGDQERTVRVGEVSRGYRLHVPPTYDRRKPTALVLALHPFAMNGGMMEKLSGLSETADRHGFLVAYPNGTGLGGMRQWNVGLGAGDGADGDGADDVGYLDRVLEDVEGVVKVDRRRVYVTGYSNGAMMSYRMAAERGERIAAVAAVAGTMVGPGIETRRAVPVLHFHGTEDEFVSYDGRLWRQTRRIKLRGVEETVRMWVEHDGCLEEPERKAVLGKDGDGLRVERLRYGPGREGSEVVLYRVEGGGHTWPGREPIVGFLGKSARELDANELIWAFFERHPMAEEAEE